MSPVLPSTEESPKWAKNKSNRARWWHAVHYFCLEQVLFSFSHLIIVFLLWLDLSLR